MFTDEESVKFLNDPAVKEKLATAKKLSDVDVKDYAAVFYVGGHGPVLDLASDPVNHKLASEVCTRLTYSFGAHTDFSNHSFTGRARSHLLCAMALRKCIPGYYLLESRELIPIISALVGATDASGKSIFVNKAFTGFSNAEEEQVQKVQVGAVMFHPDKNRP